MSDRQIEDDLGGSSELVQAAVNVHIKRIQLMTNIFDMCVEHVEFMALPEHLKLSNVINECMRRLRNECRCQYIRLEPYKLQLSQMDVPFEQVHQNFTKTVSKYLHVRSVIADRYRMDGTPVRRSLRIAGIACNAAQP